MRWTPIEDEILLKRVEAFRTRRGYTDWNAVAKFFGVSAGAARKRYELIQQRKLTPNFDDYHNWCPEEDAKLLAAVEAAGKPIRWAKVAQLFGGARSAGALKSRYHRLLRNKQAENTASPSGSVLKTVPLEGLDTVRITATLDKIEPYLKDKTLAPQKISVVESSSGDNTRVTLTAKVCNSGILAAIEEFWRDFESKHHIRKREPQTIVRDTAGPLAVIAPADIHIGKLIWGQSTGEDYNVDIACEKFVSHVERLVDTVTHYAGKLRWLVLVLGNDFFNINSHEFFGTANGTPQKQEDSRVQRTWAKARAAAIRAIEACCGAAEEVLVVMVPGNHERDLLYYFGEMLAAWFHNVPGVAVENSPKLRKYVMYGNVLLGFTHGSEEKIDSLPLIMASECPELWGAAKYREWLVGHFHRRREMKYMPLFESCGVTIRVLPPLTATDQWHYMKGFVGNTRASQAIFYNTVDGIAEAVFTVV